MLQRFSIFSVFLIIQTTRPSLWCSRAWGLPVLDNTELETASFVIILSVYIEDITRWGEDMNFMFEWQKNIPTKMFFLLNRQKRSESKAQTFIWESFQTWTIGFSKVWLMSVINHYLTMTCYGLFFIVSVLISKAMQIRFRLPGFRETGIYNGSRIVERCLLNRRLQLRLRFHQCIVLAGKKLF